VTCNLKALKHSVATVELEMVYVVAPARVV